MGTRGAFGFYKNGVTKVTYNHFDSYPSGLGDEIVNNFCRAFSLQEMYDMFDRIEMVKGDDAITDEMKGDLSVYANPEMKWMIDSASFLEDSLFCEYAYIVNLDSKMLEVYKGFIKTPPKSSRYYDPKKDYANPKYPNDNPYYPVDMIAEFALDGKLADWDAEKVGKIRL